MALILCITRVASDLVNAAEVLHPLCSCRLLYLDIFLTNENTPCGHGRGPDYPKSIRRCMKTPGPSLLPHYPKILVKLTAILTAQPYTVVVYCLYLLDSACISMLELYGIRRSQRTFKRLRWNLV